MTGRSFLVAVTLSSGIAAATQASDFAVGDVFVSIGSGKYRRFSETGVNLETLDLKIFWDPAGCLLDSSLDFYATTFTNNRVVKLSRAHPHGVLLAFDTSGIAGASDRDPEDIDLDASGNIYVGHAAGGTPVGIDVHKYDAAGILQGEFPVAAESRGSDFIDLASDGCVLFYTSEGRALKRYDICTRTQLPDFVTLPGSGVAFSVRLLPPGDGSGGFLVADDLEIKRLDAVGAVVQVYDSAGADTWFAMSLDQTGSSLWAVDKDLRRLFRFNIASGALEAGPFSVGGSANGVCVAGAYGADCPVLPQPVNAVLASRQGLDVRLRWSESTDLQTAHYNVWKVLDGDKSLVPMASRGGFLTNPMIAAVCAAVPRAAPACTDVNAVAPTPAFFYQVRGACADDSEGP